MACVIWPGLYFAPPLLLTGDVFVFGGGLNVLFFYELLFPMVFVVAVGGSTRYLLFSAVFMGGS